MLTHYRFVFTYENLKIGFQKISGTGSKVEVEYIKEGGRPIGTAAYPIYSPANSAGKLTFERGWGIYNLLYPDWFKPGKRINKPCTIIVYDEGGNISRVFGFDYGIVSAWECSGLDAEKSGLFIDTLIVEHSGLYEIELFGMINQLRR